MEAAGVGRRAGAPWLGRCLRALAVLVLAAAPVAAAWSDPSLGPSLAGYTTVGSAPSGTAGVTAYTVRIALQNSGTVGRNITAQFASAAAGTTVTQGTAHFGDIWPGDTVASTDTITVLQGGASFDPTGVVLQSFSQGPLASTPPRANAGPNQIVFQGQYVVLDGSRSVDPPGNTLAYQWQLVARPAGSAAALSNSTLVRPVFTADQAGAYVFQLVVSDGVLSSAPATVTVYTSPATVAPIAVAGPDQIATVGSLVALDGTHSTDLNGNPLSYNWSFLSVPPTSAAAIASAASPQATFVPDVAGSYVAGLTVSDGTLVSPLAATTVTAGPVTTANVPRAVVSAEQAVPLRQSVIFDGTASSDASGRPLTYRWSLIALPAGSAAALVNSTSYYPILSPDVPGVYVVQLIVNNGVADSRPVVVAVTTTPNALEIGEPYAVPGPDQTVSVGTLANFNGNSSTDPAGAALSYQWSLLFKPPSSRAQVTLGTTPQPSLVPDTAGLYIGQLAVNNGVSTSAPQTLTVRAVAPPVKAVNDTAFTRTATPVTIPVLANDSGGQGPLSVENVFLPMHGVARISGTMVVYTPAAGFNGVDRFAYSATDGLSSSTAFVTVTVAPALTPQTISFGPAPSVTVGSSGAVTATATSGLPVTLTTLTPATCSLSAGLVTGLTIGTCTIAADQAGNASYATAPQATLTFAIGAGRLTQAISFGALPTLTVGGSATLLATATSGLAVTFGGGSPTTCTVVGSLVTALAPGVCTVTASQAGNAAYAPAPSATEYLTVLGASQSITFGPAPAISVGGSGTVTATASSGLPVTFGTLTQSICSVSGATVTAVANGNCIVTADQSGGNGFGPAPEATQTIPISLLTQTIAFGAAPTLDVGGSGTLVATATSGLGVTFSSTTPTTCSVSGSTVKGIAVGTCAVAANQAGNAVYGPAPQATQSFAVGAALATQTITFGAAPTVTVGGTGTLVATASSGLPVTFGTTTPAICTVSGNGVAGVAAGTCVVTADQGGNAAYAPAPEATQSVTVIVPVAQAISFGAAPSLTLGGTATLSAVATSGLPVTFGSTTPAICTVSGSTVTGVASGICVVAADQAGDSTYAAAPEVTQALPIPLATLLYSFGASANDGENGVGSLLLANDGNFYGVTSGGGAYGAGTVFRLTPAGVETVLYSFGASATDGQSPAGSLIQASDGNFYGATSSGGEYGIGVVFRVTPAGAETVLYSFGAQSGDGYQPNGSLVQGADGAFYGVTGCGGAGTSANSICADGSGGTVFRVTAAGTETVLYSFGTQANDGLNPQSGLILASDGNFYGTAITDAAAGWGAVFRVTPAGTESVLYRFTGAPNGFGPFGPLLQGVDGNFYGTTEFGGTGLNPRAGIRGGTVFKVTPAGAESIVYSFGSTPTDGYFPLGGLVQGADGNFYGATYRGGQYANSCTDYENGCGSVFRLTPSGVKTSLYSFQGPPLDAARPAYPGSGVIFGPDGALYGLSVWGGVHAVYDDPNAIAGAGAVFRIPNPATPPLGQLISFGAGPTLLAGGAGAVSATASSGLPVTLSSATPSICTLSGGTVTGVAPGICVIHGDQAGNATYAAAPEAELDICVGANGVHNVGCDFSYASNVTGAMWSYGTTPDASTPLTLSGTTASQSSNGVTISGWSAASGFKVDNNFTGNTYSAGWVTPSAWTLLVADTAQYTTIRFTAPAAGSYAIDLNFQQAASSGTDVPVVFVRTATSTLFTASLSGLASLDQQHFIGTVALGAGQSVDIAVAPDPANSAAANVQGSISLVPAAGTTAQSITLGALAPETLGGAESLSASATSGLPVTFMTTTPAVCAVAGNTVTALTTGTCTVVASQLGNATYAPATVTQTLSVTDSRTTQTITFGGAPSLSVGGTGTLVATSTSGLPVTFSTTTSSICAVSGVVVKGLATGSCVVTANQTGSAAYAPAPPLAQTIVVAPALQSQTITFGAAPTVLVGGAGTLSATASSGLAVTFGTTTPSICSVSGSSVNGLAVGTCVVTADQAGNAVYAAATQAKQNVAIGPALLSQTITFGAAPTVLVGGSGTVSATASSGLAVTFGTTTPSICSVSGSSVNGLAVGTCVVTADQAGNAVYAAAPQAKQNVTIGPALLSQTITFGAAPTVLVGGSGTVSATASSGLAVTFGTTTPSICSVSGSSVTGLAVGTCVVTADQAGNAVYAAAPQAKQNVTIGPALLSQTITFGAAPTVLVGGAGTLSATASSGLAVTFGTTTPSICSVSGSSVNGLAVGTCVVTADQAGNAVYAAAPQAKQNVAIGPALLSQTITFGAAPTVLVGGSGTVSATASSGLAVTFGTTTPSICSVSGSSVNGLAVGTCVVTADQAGNAVYAAAPQAKQNVTIGPALLSQTITFGAAPTVLVGGSGTVSATASSGLAVTFGTTTPSICSVSGSSVTGLAVGTCVVTADQAGNLAYAPAPEATQSVAVTAALLPQVITFGSAPSLTIGGTGTLTASSSSGLIVTFSSMTPSICTVSGSSVTGVASGDCVVAADQAGNATYAAAPEVTQTLGVAVSTLLYSFGSSTYDGEGGTGALVLGSDGNYYGETLGGGIYGVGTVFRITPSGTETVLYNFGSTPTDGQTPTGGLIQASDGNFYGVTTGGGEYGYGTVFQVTPAGAMTVLYSFAGQFAVVSGSFGSTQYVDGAQPNGPLVQGADGAFYGTTQCGGLYTPQLASPTGQTTLCGLSSGAVFRVTGTGSESVLHSFSSHETPTAGLILATDGNFYGTYASGAGGFGGVFRVTPAGVESVVYSFTSAADGVGPQSPLVQGPDGNFYGTTARGGSGLYPVGHNGGTVFRVTPAGVKSTLYSFGATPTDGARPFSGLVVGTDGNFYGTTYHGGTYTSNCANISNGCGTVFRLTPAGVETQLYSFEGPPFDAARPAYGGGALTIGPDGALYGLSVWGGTQTAYGTNLGIAGAGAVFRIPNPATALLVQTITFGAAPALQVGTNAPVTASAGSGLAVTLSSATPTICTVSAGTVTGVAPGICVIHADQAGSATYLAAPEAELDICIGAPGVHNIGCDFSYASDVAAATWSYGTTPNASTPLTLSGTTATESSNGVTINGWSAANGEVDNNFTGSTFEGGDWVTPSAWTLLLPDTAQYTTIRFTAPVAGNYAIDLNFQNASGYGFDAPIVYVQTATTLLYTASITGLAANGQQHYAGSVVLGAGQTVDIAVAPDSSGTGANVQGSISLVPGTGTAAQAILVGGPTALPLNGTGLLTAAATSGLPVTFTTTTPAVCAVAGNTVTALATGTCVVIESQSGNAIYSPAATPLSIFVSSGQQSQQITFGGAPSLDVGGTGTLVATSNSGLPVAFSTTSTTCLVSGSFVQGLAVGNCIVAANQDGNATTAPAPTVTQTIVVGAALQSQTISFGAAPTVLVGGAGPLSATASSGLAVTFGTTTPSICSVSGSSVSGLAVGTCVVTANQAGNATYAAAPQATQNVAIGPALLSQTITFGAAPTVLVGGAGTLSATASSGLAVTFGTTTPSICSVSGSSVSGLAVGTCVVTANQAGNATYAAAPQATQNVAIGPALLSQTIAFGAAPTVLVGGTGTLSATASSGLSVTFGTTTPAICSVSGSSVIGLTVGTCVVTADQAGNAVYAPAPEVTQNVAIGPALLSQTITFGAAPTVLVGGTGTLSATASSGLPVTFGTVTPGVCTVSGSAVTGVAVGICIVTADQAGNSTYAPAPEVPQIIAIGQVTSPGLVIDTYAGRGPYTTPIPAAAANIVPWPIALSASGSVYFAGSSTVYRYDPSTATVTQVAGNQTLGYSGDGGPATSAQIGQVSGLAVDTAGNLYVVDDVYNVVRKVTPTGIISTLAGTGAFASSGDNGPASAAALNGPYYAHVDANNNLLIAEYNNAIRSVNLATGIITTVAGTANTHPAAVTSDAAGNVYYIYSAFAAQGAPAAPKDVLYKLAAGSTTPTVLATLDGYCSEGLAIDAGGNLYTPDYCLGNVYRISAAGAVSVIAGTGNGGFSPDGTLATAAVLGEPADVAVDSSGRVYFTDFSNFRVRAFTVGGTLTTLAGTNDGFGGPATTAALNGDYGYGGGLSTDVRGDLYLAGALAQISTGDVLSFYAGQGFPGFGGDGGPVSSAEFSPGSIAFDGNGNAYIADTGNNRIRYVTGGIVSTIAGNGTFTNTGDGATATAATVANPRALVVDSSGNVYFTVRGGGAGYSAIRQLTLGGNINRYAGAYATNGYSGDNGPATAALLKNVEGLAVDQLGNLYIADSGNNVIRMVAAGSGTITTVAGNGTAGGAGDGGPATQAELNAPLGVAVDAAGNLYISDTGNNRVRMVTPAGIISTFAGTGTAGLGGDGGPPTAAMLSGPTGIAVDNSGTVYIDDARNHRIRRIWTPGSTPQAIAFGAAPTVAVGGTAPLTAVTGSGMDVTFTSLTPSVCTVVGTTVEALASGTCIVSASADGNATYAAAPPVTQSFTVSVGGTAQSISFGTLPALTVGGTATVAPTASSGLAVALSSTTPTVCAVSGTTVSGLAVGSCGLTATQAGSATYAPAQSTTTLTVAAGLTTQTISFTSATSVVVNGTGTLSATSTSGLPVTFSSTTPEICTVAGATVTGVVYGVCIVAANQAGNATYAPAPQVIEYVPVGLDAQTITFGTAPTVVLGESGALSATASSGLAVTFATATPAVCTVSGTLVTGVAVGTCVVTANQEGSATFGAAPQVTQSFVIGQTATPGLVIDTYVGRGPYTTPIPAAAANISPWPIALSASGSVYFADHSAVYRYDPATATVTQVAGNETLGYRGDGGPATSAQIGVVSGLALDAAGNLYIVDYWKNVVRKVTPSGVISTLAGTGASASTGDNGPATAAALNFPYYAHVDANNNLLIAELGNAIRSVNLATGIITTVAGTAGTYPEAVTSDAAGNIYYIYTNFENPTVPTGGAGRDILYKLAAGSTTPTVLATLDGYCSEGLAIDAGGSLYTADWCLDNIYRISPTGTVTAIAGTSNGGFSPDGTLATAAVLGDPADVAVDSSGRVYFTDDTNYRVRAFAVGGTLTTLAGTNNGAGGPATAAAVDFGPNSGGNLSTDARGNLYWGATLQQVSPAGVLTNFAGQGFPGYGGDGGPVTSAEFWPSNMAVDANGNAYIADTGNNRIRYVTGGIVSTIAGNGTYSNSGDGAAASAATVAYPQHLVVDGAGNVYFTVAVPALTGGSGASVVRRLTVGGEISVYAGSYSGVGSSGDNGPATSALLKSISALAVDQAGNLYIADSSDNVIRKVAAGSGTITTVAGNGTAGSAGDGGPATQAELNNPLGVAVDAAGNLYIGDSNNNVVRMVTPAGIISTFAGAGPAGLGGDGGAPAAALLSGPSAIAVDPAGTVYIEDAHNHRIRRVWTPGSTAQAITFGAAPTVAVGGTAPLTAVTGSGMDATFTSLTPSVCTVVGTTIEALSSGTCTVSATADGNATYAAAPPVTQSFTVSVGGTAQSISFGTLPALTVGGAATVAPTASSGLPVNLSSTTPDICAVSGAIVTGLAAGSCGLTASQAGSATYAPAQLTANLTVVSGLTTQTITFGTAPTIVVDGTDFVSATATSGLQVTWTSTTPSICAVSGRAVTGLSGGTCIIAANQEGNATFAPAPQVTQSFTIYATPLISQALAFGTPPVLAVGGTWQATATATATYTADFSTATLDPHLSIYSTNPQITVTTFGGIATVSMPAEASALTGQTLIGSNIPLPGDFSFQVNVSYPNATVENLAVINMNIGGNAIIAATSAYESGGAGVAQGNIFLNLVGSGGRSASMADPAVFQIVRTADTISMYAAPVGSSTPSFLGSYTNPTVVGPAHFSIGLNNYTGSAAAASVAYSNLIVSYPTLSGQPIVFSSTTPAVCTVSGTTVTAVSPGTCTIAADIAGSGLYDSAPEVTQSLTVVTALNDVRTIETWAGRGPYSTPVPARSANIDPWPIAVAPNGSVYFGDYNTVYRYDPTPGTVVVVAGNQTSGFSGDNGAATSAQIGTPSGLALDSAGNLYIADANNAVVRRVTPGGTISTFAGTPGVFTSGGDGGAATAATLVCPYYLHVDANNNLLIADCGGGIRKVNLATNVISTVPNTAGTLPSSVTSDAAGNIYYIVSGYGSPTAPPDVLYQLAPGGSPAALATLNYCSEGLARDAAGNLYTTDDCTENVYQITPAGAVSVVAGTGINGFSTDGTPATAAMLSGPSDVAIDSSGTLYISELSNFRVRTFTLGGALTTIAGINNGFGGLATTAETNPWRPHLATDAAGNMYDGHLVRIGTDDVVSLYSSMYGSGGYGGDGGPVSQAVFSPLQIVFDSAGNGYVADYSNNRVRKINTAGIVSTIAGNGTYSNTGDGGSATAATIASPASIAVDGAGNVYVTAQGNTYGGACPTVIRKITPAGTISLFAGSYSATGDGGDGGAATAATFSGICGIAASPTGQVYIADTFNNVVRMVAPSGVINRVAGTGVAGYSGDNGAATSARLNQPYDVALDSAGNLHIADSANHRLRVVSASTGVISTEAGTGVAGLSGDGGDPTVAQLSDPVAVAVDGQGTVYVNDLGNNKIRRIRTRGTTAQSITLGTAPASIAVGFAGTVAATASSGLTVTFGSLTSSICTVQGTTVIGLYPGTCVVAADQTGNLVYATAPEVTETIPITP